jgi:hypothetical protein
LWALLVAALLLLAVLTQLKPVAAPAPERLPASATVSGPASSPAAPANVSAGAITQRTITRSQPVAPAPAPPATNQQPVSQAPAAGSAQCPAQAGSGLPCQEP